MSDDLLLIFGLATAGFSAVGASGMLLLKYPKLRQVIAMPPVWLTMILLFGFVADPGAIDAVGVKTGAVDVTGTGKLMRIGTVLLAGGLSALVLMRTNGLSYLFRGNTAIIAAYALIGMFSAVFSELKAMSLFKGFEILVGCMIAATLCSYRNRYDVSKKYLQWLLWIYLITTIGIYIQFLIFGPQAQRQLVGETPLINFALESRYPGMKANAVGYLGALVTLFGIHLALAKTGRTAMSGRGALIALLGFGLVFLSYTRSVLAFVVLTGFTYLVFRQKYLLVIFGALLMILPLTMPEVRTKVEDHLRRGMSQEQLETLSGRTTMWDQVMDRDVLTIISGGGFATGSLFQNYSDNPLTRGKALAQRNVHNSVFEVMMSVGVLGTALWLWLMLRIFVQLTRHKARAMGDDPAERRWHLLLLTIFMLSLLRSMMNSTFVYMDYFYPMLLGFAVYADSLRARRLELVLDRTGPVSIKPA